MTPSTPLSVTHPFQLVAQPVSISAQLRTLGEALKAVRKARGWSVSRQAGRAGLTREAVERIEQGSSGASFGEVLALCSSLGLRLIPADRDAIAAAPQAVPAGPVALSIPAHPLPLRTPTLNTRSAPDRPAEP